jgi:hypothetical protein
MQNVNKLASALSLFIKVYTNLNRRFAKCKYIVGDVLRQFIVSL